MSKEKQIEEMAEITKVHCELDNQCGSCHWETCNECLAEILYNAGYRKQSETKGCEYCKGRAYTKKPLTIITKYRRKIELVFEFCPNCGRKMRGENDD